MRLFNTETRTKEEITAPDRQIRMYTCGPTVYNYAHIGNFRTYVFEDLLRRTLKHFGFQITQAMNITDIDDKTIRGALEQKISLKAYTDPYTEAFFQDLKTLNVEKVEYYPRATDYIPQMIDLIQKLIDEKIAYKGADGSIYYAISKFATYGRLSHLNLKELKAGASERVSTDEYDKDHLADFVLWKAYDPARDGQIFWESPFGKGRPGWHIECSAMAMDLLGPTIDIHVGGVDNMFPHHENEIAQSEACTHQRFVRYWLHAEHLLVDHKKMSKSLGNFYTLRDLLKKGYTGPQIRYMLLHTHYRTQLNFTFEGLDAAVKSLERVSDFISRLRSIDTSGSDHAADPFILETRERFKLALADDLNISVALAALFDFIRDINILCDTAQVSRHEAQKIIQFLEDLNSVLGVLPLEPLVQEIPSDILALLVGRQKARADKDWKKADACRDELLSKGYLIEDTPAGARLKKVPL
ncbi:MAG: cysteine--tRNA ligase [Rhabdochlamydiaceae bacterium]|nr:cysteine--tRNA ligase [Rhabdochlamydiaceae bacterium]